MNDLRKPEDFIVEELIVLDTKPGKFLYVKLTKKNLNTLDVIEELAKKLNIPLRSIGFAGNKDKNAITTQFISLYGVRKDKISQIKIPGVSLVPLHYGSRAIALGSLNGNRFHVKVDFRVSLRNRISWMVNYYGDQRFSSNNKEIGKSILQRDFRKACSLMNNPKINDFLKANPGDYINALKSIDKKLLSLFVNAYQAFLWNGVAKKFIRDNHKKVINVDNLLFVDRPKFKIVIPLISYDTRFTHKNIKNYYYDLLIKENIKLQDYFIPQLPGIIHKTSYRPLFVQVKDFKLKRDQFIEFSLPKGSFATIFLKFLKAVN